MKKMKWYAVMAMVVTALALVQVAKNSMGTVIILGPASGTNPDGIKAGPLVTPGAPPNPPTLVVVPSEEQTNVGNAALSYPWNLVPATGATSLRYQQIYAGSNFGGVTGEIYQLGFRIAAAANSGTAFYPTNLSNVTIVISTTSVDVDSLSTTFADNIGTNAVTNFQGTLTICSSGTYPLNATAPVFDTRVYLNPPFNYQPTVGNSNLLVDITIDTGSQDGCATSVFDGQNDSSGSVARVYATNSSDTTATGSDTQGVITQFMFGNTSPGNQPGISWFMTKSDFVNISNQDMYVAKFNFDNNQTYILTDNSPTGPVSTSVPAGWSAIGGIDFKSFADLQTAISNGWVSFASGESNLEVLLYDNESWTNTPSIEQSNAYIYEPLYANVAHALGYTVVLAPATDIATNYAHFEQPEWEAYLTNPSPHRTFPVFSAKAPADIYEMQSQQLISNIVVTNYTVSDYNNFLTNAYKQAIDANNQIVGFAGINPDPYGGGVSIDQLFESVVFSTNADSDGQPVTGYWLNCSSDGQAVAVEMLQRLDSTNETANLAIGTTWSGGTGTVAITNTGSAINYPLQLIVQTDYKYGYSGNAGTFLGYPYWTTTNNSGQFNHGAWLRLTVDFTSKPSSWTNVVYSGKF